jgi:hypothetical protein
VGVGVGLLLLRSVRVGVVDGVVRGAAVPLAAGFGVAVVAGESIGKGVGVGVVFSSFRTANAEF